MEDALDAVLRKIKTRRAAGINKMSPEVRTRKFDNIRC